MLTAGIVLHIGPRNLPPALTLSLYAAANVVVVSFVPAVLFTGDRQRAAGTGYPRLPAPWLAGAGRSRAVRAAAGALGVAGLAAAAAVGGGKLWVGFWVGVVLTCGLVGNLWKLLNPWAALLGLLTAWRPLAPPLRLPAGLGAWPAVTGYLGFAVVALAPPAGPPWLNAALVAGYTALTLAGMALFGRDEWLGRCEGLTALLDIAGRFGPVEAERDAAGRVERVWLRPWGSGLLRPGAAGWDRVAFVMVVLGTLAFDGLRAAGAPVLLSPTAYAAAGSLLLAAAFLLVFAALARGMRLLAGAGADDAAAVTAFALMLVPIGLLYAAAHFSSALVGPPQAAPVLTGTDMTWFVQVTAVLAGHAIAVHLAHRHAGERFRSAQRAALSQYPVLVALVLYTMTSLWILAQPLTS